MTAHLPDLVQVLQYKLAGLIYFLLVILCGHESVFYKKASEIKHVNFIVDILVYDELN